MISQNGILNNIGEKYGEEVKKEVLDMAYSSNIYILYIASAHKMTEKDFEIGFAAYKARFPERTFESYMKFKKNWDEDKYVFDVEPQGYFLDEKTAIDYAIANMGDINEAGCFPYAIVSSKPLNRYYPYAIVSSMPLNRVYAFCNEGTHKLFHYNKETDKYDPMDWDYSEETKYLRKEVDICWKHNVHLDPNENK